MQFEMNMQDVEPLINALTRIESALNGDENGSAILFVRQGHSDDSWQTFAKKVLAWQQAWLNQPEKNWAIYFKDTGHFLAALLGACLAGKTIYLLGDTLPHTLEQIREHVAGFVGDFEAQNKHHLEWIGDQSGLHAASVVYEYITDARLVFLTSGSSAQPKLIEKTLAQLCAEVMVLTEQFGTKAAHPSVTHATVSHQHFYGFVFRVFWPFLEQRTMAAHTIRFPEELLALSSQSPIVLISSPAFLSRVTERDDWPLFANQLKMVVSAGGVLTNQHHQHIKALWDAWPDEIYGSTENGVIAYRHALDTDGVLTALPSVQLKADDGLLWLRSSYMDKHSLRDGWSATSDKVTMVNTHQFELIGRADRVVKIEEKRVSLTKMEHVLARHPWVSVAHVVALTLPRTALGVVIVLNEDAILRLVTEGRASIIKALKQYLNGYFERLVCPRRWRFVAELPLNSQGKLERHALECILNLSTEVTFPVSRCIQSGPEVVILDLTIPVDLLYLKGHFNQQPIVPGVALIEWVAFFANNYFQLPNQFKSIKQLKFHHIIGPTQQVQLQLSKPSTSNTVKFTYSLDEQIAASGMMQWEQEA